MVPFRHRLSRESRRSQDETHDANSFERDPYIMTFPIHPLPSMQAPFEESMLDATGETGFVPFQNPNKSIDLRQQLLCRDTDASELEWNFTYNCHWRNHPKGKFHPLLKTVAQIAFGVHLLHQRLEKSVADVADILLKHVNELDGFLQRANEDIEGSLRDMLFRRKCLKVPMEHVNEFDRLLDDRVYRAQLLDGNITIERTINRMSELLNDYLIDMSTFRDANNELDMYLSHIGNAWADDEDVGRIYSAMCGNTAGWAQFLQSLVAKAEKLGVVLVQVSSYCNEIEKRCGAASRRSMIASRSSSRSTNSRDTTRAFRNFADNKPLPMVPNERPPFITTPDTNDHVGSGSEEVSFQGHPKASSPSKAEQVRRVENADTEDSSKEVLTGPSTSGPPDGVVSGVSESTPEPSSKMQHHQPEGVSTKDEPQYHKIDQHDMTEKIPVTNGENESPHSDSDGNDTVVPKRITINGGKEEHSPPLTGKDSAYSSVSGGSFASPAAVHPRSASSQGSYSRPQFGLFPSSVPSTPQRSISGRYGALSPGFPSPKAPDQPAYQPIQRSQSAMDSHASSRKLLKKSSLSSLKRLFTKKKHGAVESIAE